MKKDFNKKAFLLPNSITSMAAVHAKIYDERGEYQLRISDCNETIKLWGRTITTDNIQEGIGKMNNLIAMANDLKTELEKRLLFSIKKDMTPTFIKPNIKKWLYGIDFIGVLALKNNVTVETMEEWLDNNNPELLKVYNLNFIADLIGKEQHDIWE